MKNILIALFIMISFNSLSLNAQKTLTKPTKKAQTTQAKPHNPSKPKSGSKKKRTDTMVVDYVRPQEMQNTQIHSSISLKPTGTINGHEYVDLGLSVKWAMCNVGASSPYDFGSYFAWGETTTKHEYTENNSVTWGKSMSDIASISRYDAARAKWGGTWRLPTKAEIEELVNRCKTRWITQDGHNGYLVTGPNGKSIFFPDAGYCNGVSITDKNGYYWSSTPYNGGTQLAYCLFFYSYGDRFEKFDGARYKGYSVRPVLE